MRGRCQTTGNVEVDLGIAAVADEVTLAAVVGVGNLGISNHVAVVGVGNLRVSNHVAVVGRARKKRNVKAERDGRELLTRAGSVLELWIVGGSDGFDISLTDDAAVDGALMLDAVGDVIEAGVAAANGQAKSQFRTSPKPLLPLAPHHHTRSPGGAGGSPVRRPVEITSDE